MLSVSGIDVTTQKENVANEKGAKILLSVAFFSWPEVEDRLNYNVSRNRPFRGDVQPHFARFERREP